MNKNEMLNYIIAFAADNNWKDDKVPEQIRSFFTAWAFMFHVDADTQDCDDALNVIYFRAELEAVLEYEEFEDFMLEFIV